MILVTGGCGFIGAALVKALLRNGDDVRVLDDMSRGRCDRLINYNVEIVKGDVRDKHAVANAAQDVSEIIHLACINGTKNFYERPGDVLDVGVGGMQAVLYAVKAHHIERLTLFSSSEVYQDADIIPTSEHVTMKIPNVWNPRYSYAAVKIISEMLAMHNCAAPHTLILRPHNIYGPDMGYDHVIAKMCRVISQGKPIRFSSEFAEDTFYGPSETRAFCYIEDCISQIMLVRRRDADRKKYIYNIGSDEEIRIESVARRISKLAGLLPMFQFDKGIEGSPVRRCPDMTLMKQLGFVPQYSLDAGLKLTYEWYQKESKNVIALSELRSRAAAPGS